MTWNKPIDQTILSTEGCYVTCSKSSSSEIWPNVCRQNVAIRKVNNKPDISLDILKKITLWAEKAVSEITKKVSTKAEINVVSWLQLKNQISHSNIFLFASLASKLNSL
jgi:hypothetical protein